MRKTLPPLAPPEPQIQISRRRPSLGLSAEFLLIGAALTALILG